MPSSFSGVVVRFVRACPVTAAVLVLAVALAGAEAFHRATLFDPLGSRHALGAVEELKFKGEPDLHGPLALWEGEWWRIPVSAFHHGGGSAQPFDPVQWLHLAMNCLALACLAWLLEPRMPRLVYLLFVLGATVVSVLPEFLLEHLAYGLSGVACAQFGALLVLRRRDAYVADVLPPPVVWLAFGWLLMCIPLTMFDVAPIANVAHFTGLAYGWLAGQVVFGRAATRAGRLAFAAAHLAIVPGLYAATHPVWIGRYHWYLAGLESETDRRVERWQQALNRDPGLARLWLLIAEHEFRDGRPIDAWRTILAGLDANRDFERGDRFARRLWRFLRSREVLRQQARQILAERFGPEEPAWRSRLGIPPSRVEAIADLRLPGRAAAGAESTEPDVGRFRLDQQITLPPVDGSRDPRNLTAPAIDPDDPSSAVLGRPL